MMDRLNPKRIVVVSSPQIKVSNYYGIDMAKQRFSTAFRTASKLLKEEIIYC
jgi:glutamine phosphoribosylpyrophosphate amidotransferase